MNGRRQRRLGVAWHEAQRRNASDGSVAGRWIRLAGLAAAGAWLWAGLLTAWRGEPGAPLLPDASGLRAPVPPLPSAALDKLVPYADQAWLLAVSRVTHDLALAAGIVSGLGAIAVLFLVYLLTHECSDPARADEQACFAVLALLLSSGFLKAAVWGGMEILHLALLLAVVLLLQRAPGAKHPLPLVAGAGLLAGLSLLLRPVSLLIPVAVLFWLWRTPWSTSEELEGPSFPAALVFLGAFAFGAAPLFLSGASNRSLLLDWGPAEAVVLAQRLASEPLGLLRAVGSTLLQYLGSDDLLRLATVVEALRRGAWDSLGGALVALAPTLVKVLGIAGLAALIWLERGELAVQRARLPLILLGVLVVGGALGIVDGRSPLPVTTLLIVFAFAGLGALLPGAGAVAAGLALVGLLVMGQFGAGSPLWLTSQQRHADQVATVLHEHGARPEQVLSASWTFYDTRSPAQERYRPIPLYVDSLDQLVAAMRRQGTRYLVYDRDSGVEHWPRLAELLTTERPDPRLRRLTPPLTTESTPPNTIVIYTLE